MDPVTYIESALPRYIVICILFIVHKYYHCVQHAKRLKRKIFWF